jgi:anthranilate/para-aminobenzoate synthase component I
VGIPAELGALDGKPLEVLERVVEAVRFERVHRLVGWLGFVSYDVGRFLERVGEASTDELKWPVLWFSLFRHYLVMEGGRARAYRVGDGKGWDWEGFFRVGKEATTPASLAAPPLAEVTREVYERKIGRVKEYIAAGDIYQANLAQRWKARTSTSGAEVFARLCKLSPMPYGACLRFTEGGVRREVASASPELLLSVEEAERRRRAVTRPIKGTRRRVPGDAGKDGEMAAELMGSAKDAAELTMIVDLERNDLGKVSEFGSVRVAAARELEAHPTVWHTTGTVEGRLREEVGLAQLLAAMCPGGSITGAPKVRAMQIIEELEGFRRGLYCGNMGVIGDGGREMILNIAIRTVMMQEGWAHVYAGGGIVADSEAGKEWEETVVKAGAMVGAVGGGNGIQNSECIIQN